MADEQDFSETEAYSKPDLRGLQQRDQAGAPESDDEWVKGALNTIFNLRRENLVLQTKIKDVNLALITAIDEKLADSAANRRKGLREGLIMARRFVELGVDIRRLDIESLTAD